MGEKTGEAREVAGFRMMLGIGGAAALVSALGALADVAIGTMTGGAVSALPHDAVGRFAELAANPALGLYNLDLLNLATTLVMVPALYACWLALGRAGAVAGLALVFGVLGAAVFVSNNAALPMLGLSMDYASADGQRRALLAAAGEAILAKGAHGSPGVLAGFLLASFSNLLLSGAMLRTGVFSRATALLGLCGTILLSAYLILVTVFPAVRGLALAFAAPGGLLAIAWILSLSLRLFRLSRVAATE